MLHKLVLMPTGKEKGITFFPSMLIESHMKLHGHKHISTSSFSFYDYPFRCIVRALKDPNTFLFDHLLALKPVRFLEGELIHDVSMNMVALVLQYILP